MDGRKGFPREGTQAHRLLELTAICGEIPADLVRRLPGGASYKESVVTSLKRTGLLQTYYRDRLRGYRLGRRGKEGSSGRMARTLLLLSYRKCGYQSDQE